MDLAQRQLHSHSKTSATERCQSKSELNSSWKGRRIDSSAIVVLFQKHIIVVQILANESKCCFLFQIKHLDHQPPYASRSVEEATVAFGCQPWEERLAAQLVVVAASHGASTVERQKETTHLQALVGQVLCWQSQQRVWEVEVMRRWRLLALEELVVMAFDAVLALEAQGVRVAMVWMEVLVARHEQVKALTRLAVMVALEVWRLMAWNFVLVW
jgi:hypothetical protein